MREVLRHSSTILELYICLTFGALFYLKDEGDYFFFFKKVTHLFKDQILALNLVTESTWGVAGTTIFDPTKDISCSSLSTWFP